MKKLLCIMCAALLLFSVVACGTSTSSDEPKKQDDTPAATDNTSDDKLEETPAPIETNNTEDGKSSAEDGIYSNDDFEAKYISHNIVKDYQDKDCIRLVYEYTNKEEDSQSFMFATNVKAFQNGVELKTAITMGDDEEEDNSLKEIKNGVTIEVARIFVLSDDSDVTVEISPLVSFDKSDKIETVYSVK